MLIHFSTLNDFKRKANKRKLAYVLNSMCSVTDTHENNTSVQIRKASNKCVCVVPWLYPGENFTGSSKIFKDLLEDLDEDLCNDPQQRSLKILKDPNFSCQDP